jgi:hypothetical protein
MLKTAKRLPRPAAIGKIMIDGSPTPYFATYSSGPGTPTREYSIGVGSYVRKTIGEKWELSAPGQRPRVVTVEPAQIDEPEHTAPAFVEQTLCNACDRPLPRSGMSLCDDCSDSEPQLSAGEEHALDHRDGIALDSRVCDGLGCPFARV